AEILDIARIELKGGECAHGSANYFFGALPLLSEHNIGDLLPFAGDAAAIVERHYTGVLEVGVIAPSPLKISFLGRNLRDDTVDLIRRGIGQSCGAGRTNQQNKSSDETHNSSLRFLYQFTSRLYRSPRICLAMVNFCMLLVP